MNDARWTIVEHSLEECASTQDEARRIGDGSGPGTVTVLVAERQSAGRGREGRTWVQAPGRALCCSVHVQGPLPSGRLAHLPEAAAGIVVDALAVALDDDAVTRSLRVQAPNDIYEQGGERKVGGVLIDSRSAGNELLELTFGAGVNLTGPQFEVEGRTAASLGEVAGIDMPAGIEQRIAREIAGLLITDWLA